MLKKEIIFRFVAVLLFFQINLFSQNIQKLPEGVSLYQLDNGIKVLFIENPALPMIGVNTVVKVGSAYETFSSSGMSHMLEHLLFNGTTRWTQRELYDLTDKIGGYNNANTSEYYTNYMMVTPAENIKKGMEIQAEMLFNSILPEKKFQKEKGIVLEEIAKSLGNANEQLDRNVRDILYAGHALSLPTLGTYETIKNMNRDDVYEFYKNNYVPNNMLMSVIGNFNTSEMLKLVTEIYGTAKPGNVVRPNITEWGTGFSKIGFQKKEKVNHRFYKGKEIILQHFYDAGNKSVEFYEMLGKALDKNLDSVENKLNKKFPDLIKSVEFSQYNFPVGNFIEVDLVLNEDNKISEISNELNNIIGKINLKLSDNEINSEAVKSQSDFLKQIEKPHMFGIYNANVIAQKGLGAIIKSFSGDEIINAGKELNDFKIVRLANIIVEHPVKESAEEVGKTETMLFENAQGNPVVIAKQNSASNLLAIHYMIKYKNKYESRYGNDVAKKWHDAFGNRMKSDANRKKSANFGLSFVVNDIPFIPMDDIYLSPAFGYIRVEGLAKDIEGVIKYLNEEMLNFVPTEEEFNKVNKPNMFGMMGRGKNKSKELYKKTYESLVLEPQAETKNIKMLNYEKFLEFGKEYFAPSNMIISVVSKEAPAKINEYFKDFSSDIMPKYSGLADVRSYKLWDKPQKVEKDGGGEQSYTFYGFVKEIDKNDKAALTVLSLMLRDKISFNIREKQGLAYRMSSGIGVKRDKALVYVEVPTQPGNVEKLVAQFPKLFSTNFADHITAEELEKTINMYLGKMMFRRLSSINQAYYLAHSLYYDGDINADENELTALKKVKLNDLKKAAHKYLKITNPIEIIIH